jgi:hypothetical protein
MVSDVENMGFQMALAPMLKCIVVAEVDDLG